MIGEALLRIRDVDPHDREAWAEVLAFLHRVRSPWLWSRAEADEAVQRALVTIARKLRQTHGNAAQLSRWVRAVWRSRAADVRRERVFRRERSESGGYDDETALDRTICDWQAEHRANGRPADPLTHKIRSIGRDPDRPHVLDVIDGAGLIRRVIEQVLDHVDGEPLRRDCIPPRTLAEVTLDSVVWGLDGVELMERHGAPSRGVAYKWVERGRAHAASAIRDWAVGGEWAPGVAEVLLELVEKRRVDAGRTRPERRAA